MEENKISRRKFIIRGVGAVIGLQFLAMFAFFGKSKMSKTEDKWVEIGTLEEFEHGKTYSFPEHKLFLYCDKKGAFLALSSKCTHLGCAVSLDSKTDSYICPCHASHFDKFGSVRQSPAKRPLDYFAVKISGNKVLVDTARPIKRERFNNSQLTTA